MYDSIVHIELVAIWIKHEYLNFRQTIVDFIRRKPYIVSDIEMNAHFQARLCAWAIYIFWDG